MKKKVYIGVLVVALSLATVTGIVERYRLNKDNLIQYFSADTVVYLHARLHTDQIVSSAFEKFLNLHPNFNSNLYPQIEEYLNIWPEFDPSLVEEVSLGIIKKNDNYVPVVAILAREETSVSDMRNDWEEQGLFVKQDEKNLVASLDENLLDMDSKVGLRNTFRDKRRPMSNAWYGYVDLYRAGDWLKLQKDFYKIDEIVNTISLRQSDIFASLTFRDDMMIITEDVRSLEKNDRILNDWKLRFGQNNAFIANDIVFSSDLLQQVTRSLDALNPNTKKRPGIIERFVLEQVEIGDILNNLSLFPEVSVVVNDSQSEVLIELTKLDDFSQENLFDLLKQLASYDYPSEKQIKLVDGSFITELVAEDSEQITIKSEDFSFGTVFSLISGENQWEYSILENESSVFLATNKDLFSKAFSPNEVAFEQIVEDCLFGDSSYLANTREGNQKSFQYVLNFVPESITFCLR